ncbi:MAG: HesA/MoeB/ThiF family protein [Firmicutes bacterium]|nr:HesA/MoeB/ThiF family protein [Bacillota bacterium]
MGEQEAFLRKVAVLAREFPGPDGTPRRVLAHADLVQLAREEGLSQKTAEMFSLRGGYIPLRYLRNIGTIGIDGQDRLLQATVGVVGAGGLGGGVIELLARMGVGRLIVIDGDSFEDNNLNRQLLSREDRLGSSKAGAAQERVAAINSAVEVVTNHLWLTGENGAALLSGAEVVVDCLDSLPARFLLEGICRDLGVPMVHGAIGGFMGQVMTIFPGDEGLGAIYGPPTGAPERGVETRLGNPAATPTMVAAWQVHEVVKILLGKGQTLRHRLLIMDAESGEVRVIGTGGNPQ